MIPTTLLNVDSGQAEAAFDLEGKVNFDGGSYDANDGLKSNEIKRL